jgi:hypothetical protein
MDPVVAGPFSSQSITSVSLCLNCDLATYLYLSLQWTTPDANFDLFKFSSSILLLNSHGLSLRLRRIERIDL